MKIFCILALLFFVPSAAGAELPDFYKNVDALVWVVPDIGKAVEGWSRLGFTGIQNLGETEADEGAVQFRGHDVSLRLKLALGRIGETAVYWIQPGDSKDAYGEFLKKHGSGVFSLMHRVPSLEALDAEVARMKTLGIGILQRGELSAGAVRYVFFDTEPEGKIVLGLIAGAIEKSPIAVPSAPQDTPRITQYAFAAKEMETISKFWTRLGFPEFAYTHPEISELRYKNQPGDFDMRLGWQRHGKVPYEWIQSLEGPNVYLDHIAAHGEGLHHIAFNVQDMDREVTRWVNLGFPYSMGGAWGEKGKPGSGRFVYVSTQAIGGTDVELLWNFR